MTKSLPKLLLSTVLIATACGSSKPASTDASGSAGSTGNAGSGGSAGTAGTTGGGGAGGTTGDAAAGTTGAAGGDASAGTTGAAGGDAAAGTTGAAGGDAAADTSGDTAAAGATGTDAGTDGDSASTTDATSDVASDAGATSASTPIAAATGGTASISGATLKIPASALASDATITVSATAPTAATPDQATIVGNVVDLGPTGTQFTTPAVLALTAGTVPAGQRAVISVLDTGAWVDLPSVVANGKVYASLKHLSSYAVRNVGAPACTDFSTTVSCGTGTLTGTWTAAVFCNGALDTSEFPTGDKLLAACADTAQAAPVTGGTATLNADLSFSATLVPPAKGSLTGVLSSTCTSTAASCDAVAAQIVAGNVAFTDAACTGTPAAGCTCTAVYKPPVLAAASGGTYTVAAGKMGFSTGIPARRYCANNGTTPQTLYYSWGSDQNNTQFGWIFTK